MSYVKCYSIRFRGGLKSYSDKAWKFGNIFLPKAHVKPDQDEQQRFWVPEWLCDEHGFTKSRKYCWMQDGIKMSIIEHHVPMTYTAKDVQHDTALDCTDRIHTEVI